MKKPALTGWTFNPTAKTLDFTGTSGFTVQSLLVVIHEPTGQTLYAKGRTAFAPAAISGSVITLGLSVSTTGMNAADPLYVLREDGADAATDSRLATTNTTLSNLSTGIGTPADAAAGSDTASGSLIAKITRLLASTTGQSAILTTISNFLRGATTTTDATGTLTPATNAAVVAANATRSFAEITNTGANPLAYRWGSAATATAGHILGPGQSARYDGKVSSGALNMISTLGTTYFVTTG